jgi:hypothetical protein
MFAFGSGALLGFRTDIATQTPINFGLIQDCALDWSFDNKELYGQNQYPVAIGRGKAKVTGKAKLARISGLAFGTLFFGVTPVAGQVATAFAESATPGTTITVSNGATFVDDLGVVFSTTGLPLTKVTSGPTTGQYSVAAGGIYTFAVADAGKVVLISYTYTISSTGEKIVLTNPLMGTTPTFQAQLYTTFQGNQLSVKLPNCASSKLSFATKLDDFTIPEMDFSVYADAGGNIGTWSFAEAS